MKKKQYINFLLCFAFFVLVVFSAVAESDEGQLILDKYTTPDQLGQPFLTSIRPFTGNVKEESVSKEVQDILSAYRQLTIKAYDIDGIHIYDVYKDDGKKKPLLIYLHPGGSSRDFFLWWGTEQKKWFGKASFNDYTKAGIRVITVDAAGLGSSDIGPIDYLPSQAETVHYIDRIIEYYNTVDDVDATKFALQGFSMGADIALAYIAHGSYKPTVVISESGIVDKTLTPDGPLYACFDHGKDADHNIMSKEQIKTFAERYSPNQWLEKFKDVYILAGCGMDEDEANIKDLKNFEAKLNELGYKDFQFIYEKNHGHSPLDYVSRNGLSVLKKTLLKK